MVIYCFCKLAELFHAPLGSPPWQFVKVFFFLSFIFKVHAENVHKIVARSLIIKLRMLCILIAFFIVELYINNDDISL